MKCFKPGDLASLKRIREIIKYAIIGGEILFTASCLFAIFGFSVPIITLIFGMCFNGYLVLILSTYILGFCTNIRLMLTHIFGVRLCYFYQIYYGFGALLTPMRWIMFVLGVYLIFKTLKDSYVEGSTIIST